MAGHMPIQGDPVRAVIRSCYSNAKRKCFGFESKGCFEASFDRLPQSCENVFMNIELTPEIQQIANAAVSSGDYDSVAEFIAAAVRDKQSEILPDAPEDHEKWMAEVKAWSNDHPGSTHFVDDSRESIYEGHGL